jgi:hypothetical protein
MAVVEDERRQRAVDGLGLAQDGSHPRLDRITRLACLALGVPMAAVTVLDRGMAWFPSAQGFDPGVMPRDDTFCATTIDQDADAPMEVVDATQDERFKDLPVVLDGVNAYVGLPLRDHTGTPVATFCVFDRHPRQLTEEQREAFEDLAAWAERELVASTEMQQASRVQASLLPSRPVRVGEWDVDGLCLPALAVGGDFYDYEVSSGVLHVSLGDVMGKGTGAALIGAATRTALRATSPAVSAGVDLGVTVTHVARSMLDDLERAESFVTLIDLAVDLESGLARYVDAGSGLLLLVRADGTPQRLSGRDRPLGVLPDDHWGEVEVSLAPGDRLVLFSDGVLDLLPDPDDWPTAVGAWVSEAPDLPTFLTSMARTSTEETALDDITVVGVFRHGAPGQA